jgi:hypothetical protein
VTLQDVLAVGILPALRLLPERMTSEPAIRFLLATGLQESLFQHREQIRGPARGWWQFEIVGIEGVLTHPASAEYAHGLCRVLGYEPECDDVYRAIKHNDTLAAGFARLLLWRLPEPLPTTPWDGWSQYLATWAPGRPRRALWPDNWKSAQEVAL